ncbi:uncharacterized protein MONBRDRAFT_23268, partial [Monosiga brevicollis MX1]
PHEEFAQYFLTEDQRQNHILIGSVPHDGIKYVRIHFLLDLIHVANAYEVDCDSATWTCFNESALDAFGQVVTALAKRYIGRYGLQEEPEGECKEELQANIQCNLAAFINYWDVIEHALHQVDGQLIFGGPASDGDKSFFVAIVEHCLTGTHYVTGAAGCGNITYFNFHQKGLLVLHRLITEAPSLGNSNSLGIIEQEKPLATWLYQQTRHTAYADTAFGNDEADPLVTWSRIEPWRADARYPAMIVKTIKQHMVDLIYNSSLPGFRYDLLSNDNGFLNYPDNGPHAFTQRTLVSRFDYNATQSIASFRKLSLNVMALLSLLGDRVTLATTGTASPDTDIIGTIATVRGDAASREVAVLLYASNDAANDTIDFTVLLNASHWPSFSDGAVAVAFALDDAHGSAFAAWQAQGAPTFPSVAEREAMRQAAEIPLVAGFPQPVSEPEWRFNIPAPGLVLLHVCEQRAAPAALAAPRLHVTTTRSPPEVYILWNDAPDRCLLTYEVMYSATSRSDAIRVNPVATRFTAYLHVQNGTLAQGCYSVTVTDYWGQSSPPSPVTCL